MSFRRSSSIAAPLVALVLLSGCATVGQDRLAEKDPLEKVNRGIWAVDMAADKVIMRPAAKVYRAVTPAPARRGISNAFANLTEPWSFINNVLQGHGKRAMRNLGRFAVNSTIGIGGLFDHASKMGMPAAYEDLGQTMAVWGFNAGPYLVLPIFGPSTMRDAIGQGLGRGRILRCPIGVERHVGDFPSVAGTQQQQKRQRRALAHGRGGGAAAGASPGKGAALPGKGWLVGAAVAADVDATGSSPGKPASLCGSVLPGGGVAAASPTGVGTPSAAGSSAGPAPPSESS